MRILNGWLVALLAGALPIWAQLRFEAETVSGPESAWLRDRFAEDHWTLWSTDKDAERKWSGGVVLRAPIVTADRGHPEDGAPPLHTVIRGVTPGTYAVDVKVNRVLGVSLDGKQWRRFTGGTLIPSITLAKDGVVEFWVDDRFAMEKEEQRGSGYFDYVELTRWRTWEDGIANPDFEALGEDGTPSDWNWWSRDAKGSVEGVTEGAHGGRRAARIRYDGEHDWAYTNGTRLAAPQGTDLCISGWVRGVPGAESVSIDVVGWLNGKVVTWHLGTASARVKAAWTQVRGYLTVPDDVDSLQVRVTGVGPADVVVDDVALKPGKPVFPVKPKVTGWATERLPEPMGRGAVAMPLADGTVRVSWRLLAGEPPDIGFDVFRQVAKGQPVRLNAAPIVATTDFVDRQPPAGQRATYSVRPAAGNGPAGDAIRAESEGGTPCVRIPLSDAATRFQKVAVADLNGDGQYDYVIKQPHENIDPWVKYWYKSPETYKLEAYLADGTFLWRNDLGWGIERGIWYSPYIVWDLTGDGKAEVAAKIGEGDPRDPDGRVTSGAEFVVVWDGMSGSEIGRAPWPARDSFDSYNHASRNQIAVAYLDGKTPCLLLLRGTYTRMLVDAYQLRDGALEKLWAYDNRDFGAAYWGQGAHFTLAADIDGDGRDEVVLGSAVIDDNGVPLWSTGRGHPDAAYLTDILPDHPGLEIAYGMETAQRRGGGLNLVDARTGKALWRLDTPTRHVHSKGMCADIDATVAGFEIYGADANGHTLTEHRWLFAADGTLLRQGKDCPWSFAIPTVFWDADLQQELIAGRVIDYQGGPVGGPLPGNRVLVADVLGDWREEVITSVPGELRVYCTPIPAMDRRVCLMQDPLYRLGTAMNAMGYTQAPTLSYNPEQVSPNLNLTALETPADTVRVVVSAPETQAVEGRVILDAPEGMGLQPARFDVAVKPGERQVQTVAMTVRRRDRLEIVLRARLEMKDGRVLHGQVPLSLAGSFLTDGLLVQAEAFAAEEGGEVHIRTDKAGVMEKAISHWDAAGHALTWKLDVPNAGAYQLVLRYCAPHEARRSLRLDGNDLGDLVLPETGGFGDNAFDWAHVTAATAEASLRLRLTAGEHVIRLENRDDKGCNLDYLALLPAP